ncbi:helix-turn-helix domain-containing protein [Lactococcus fujiensis]|nr:helix-turn-helix transcriptional regulator [Lactococcus fujiensis]
MNENMTSFEYSVTPLKLGDKIKNIRIKLSLSQEDLAALLKPPVAVDTVKFWENNFGVPLLDYCVQISDLGVVTLDWLLKD